MKLFPLVFQGNGRIFEILFTHQLAGSLLDAQVPQTQMLDRFTFPNIFSHKPEKANVD